MKVTIEITQAELDALKRIYSKKGLGVNLPGNRPSPEDTVVKKIVEELNK